MPAYRRLPLSDKGVESTVTWRWRNTAPWHNDGGCHRSKQASRQAGKQASRQAGKQARKSRREKSSTTFGRTFVRCWFIRLRAQFNRQPTDMHASSDLTLLIYRILPVHPSIHPAPIPKTFPSFLFLPSQFSLI
ncbi:hypothetical protein BKA80DRAFT_35090 [Phyllosticta citrichinensis]